MYLLLQIVDTQGFPLSQRLLRISKSVCPVIHGPLESADHGLDWGDLPIRPAIDRVSRAI